MFILKSQIISLNFKNRGSIIFQTQNIYNNCIFHSDYNMQNFMVIVSALPSSFSSLINPVLIKFMRSKSVKSRGPFLLINTFNFRRRNLRKKSSAFEYKPTPMCAFYMFGQMPERSKPSNNLACFCNYRESRKNSTE